MSVKVKAMLKVVAYMEAGFKLVDASGESPQVITQPMILSSSEKGISSENLISTSLDLSTEQIADLVHQKNNGRGLVVLMELSE